MNQLAEQATRHQVYLERLKSGEANQFASFLKQIDRSVRLRLSGEDLTSFSRKRLERLLVSVEKDLNKIYAAHYDQLSGNLIELAEYEAGFESRSLNNVLTNFETTIPSIAQVTAAVFSAPLSVRGSDGGKLLELFIKDWSSNESKRVSNAIRQGFYEGQTTSQILQKVRGTRAKKYSDGILAMSNRHASSVVKTAVQHVASTARMQTWKDNSDIITGYRWLSTLDSRTTQTCQSLDGQVFKIDKGPLPPIHIGCRSTTTPELDSRYAVTIDDDKRASVSGPVDADLTYYDWLKTQSADFQNQAIGKSRAILLRDGGLSAERFAELNLGRNFKPLNLYGKTVNGKYIPGMKDIEPLAFEKAGL